MERRAEEERAAHNATKMVFPPLKTIWPCFGLVSFVLSCSIYFHFFVGEQAAMEREVELEHRAAEASTALARIQVW